MNPRAVTIQPHTMRRLEATSRFGSVSLESERLVDSGVEGAFSDTAPV